MFVKSSVSSTTQKRISPNLLKRRRIVQTNESETVNTETSVVIENTETPPVTNTQNTRPAPKVVGKVIKPIEVSIPKVVEETDEITIKQLIEDKFKHGKLSSQEINRRELLREKRRNRGTEIVHTPKETTILPTNSQPKLIVVNGKMVLDSSSIQISQPELPTGNIIEEDASNRYVTSLSFRNKHKLPNTRWTPQMIDRFYQGLSYFGTDFKQISYMFPTLTHKAIKLRFKAEEKKCSEKVSRALRERRKAPDDIKKKMLDGVRGKRIVEDSVYVKSRLGEGSEGKQGVLNGQNTKKPDGEQVHKLEPIAEEVEEPSDLPKEIVQAINHIPQLEMKSKPSNLKGMVAKGIKRRKKAVVTELSESIQVE